MRASIYVSVVLILPNCSLKPMMAMMSVVGVGDHVL